MTNKHIENLYAMYPPGLAERLIDNDADYAAQCRDLAAKHDRELLGLYNNLQKKRYEELAEWRATHPDDDLSPTTDDAQ